MATTTPKQFKISDLLADAIQPFPNMEQEELDGLALSLKAPGALKGDPVKLGSAKLGYRLFDGSQRLSALLLNGRQTISEGEFRIYDDVTTEDDALFWATRYNAGRRQLTHEQRIEHALRLRQDHRWSDRRIADAMNLSAMTIGRWLKGEAKPELVVGKDGVMQPPKATKVAAPAAPPPPWVDPWQGDGPTLKAVVRLTAVLEQMVDNAATNTPPSVPREAVQGPQQFGFCKQSLEELRKAIEAVLAEMTAPKPTPTKRPAKKVAGRPRTVNGG